MKSHSQGCGTFIHMVRNILKYSRLVSGIIVSKSRLANFGGDLQNDPPFHRGPQMVLANFTESIIDQQTHEEGADFLERRQQLLSYKEQINILKEQIQSYVDNIIVFGNTNGQCAILFEQYNDKASQCSFSVKIFILQVCLDYIIVMDSITNPTMLSTNNQQQIHQSPPLSPQISGRIQPKMQMVPFEIEQNQIKTKFELGPTPTDGSQRMDANIGKQVKVVIIITSCIFFLGFNRALISAIVNSKTTKQFQKLFNFQGNVVTTKAVLSAMSPMGAFFGTIACSFFIKSTSPRQILFKTCMLAIIFTITTMYTQIIILMIFRFGIGWCVGTFVAIVPSYIRQITSKNIAPYFGTFPVINQSLGGFLSFVLAFSIYQGTSSVKETWIIMCALNIIPLIAIIICIKIDFIYQSPIFLLRMQQRKDALAIYQMIYRPEYVKSILKEKELEIKRFYFTQLKQILTRQNNEILKRKDILIGVHLPVLRKMTGVLVIILSSGSMLKSIHPQFERKAPMLISLVYFISCFLSNIVLKYMSRRGVFQLGTITICVLNLLLAAGYLFQIAAVAILVFKVLLLIMYGLTLGPLVWAYLPEVVPARIIPIAQSMNWLIDCFTLSLPGVIIAHHGNPWPLFFVFALWDFLSIFINHFILVETKRKTIAQIIQSLDKNK